MNTSEKSLFEAIKQRSKALKTQTYTLMLVYQDPRTPWYARVFSALVVAYAFSPIDLIPDFIPILGYLDDLILIPAGVALAIKMIPVEVMDAAREKAVAELREGKGKPVNRAAGVLIVFVWLLLAFFAARWVWGMFSR